MSFIHLISIHLSSPKCQKLLHWNVLHLEQFGVAHAYMQVNSLKIIESSSDGHASAKEVVQIIPMHVYSEVSLMVLLPGK